MAPDIAAYLQQHESKGLLRFITCGSVDDGKSTLIGRLLHDTKLLLDDQVAALEADSRRHGTQGGELDFALLVDGLAAEREQGITIDVAYRFFGTERRKFIVADCPGHEQYTRNMATGASNCHLAIILIDARPAGGIFVASCRKSALIDETLFLFFVAHTPFDFVFCMWGACPSGGTSTSAIYINYIRAKSIPHPHTISTITQYAHAGISIIGPRGYSHACTSHRDSAHRNAVPHIFAAFRLHRNRGSRRICIYPFCRHNPSPHDTARRTRVDP